MFHVNFCVIWCKVNIQNIVHVNIERWELHIPDLLAFRHQTLHVKVFQIWISADHWWIYYMYSLWLVWYLCTVVSSSLQMRQKTKTVVLWSACNVEKVLAWLQPSYSHPLSSRNIRQLCVSIMIVRHVRIIHILYVFSVTSLVFMYSCVIFSTNETKNKNSCTLVCL